MAKLFITAFWLILLSLLTGCQFIQDDKLPPILYLSWDENGRVQLYQTEVNADPTQLTHSQHDIIDFAPTPDSRQIIYSTGDELWLLRGNGRIDKLTANRSPRLLLTCAPAHCDQIVWHPDGRRLLYERTEPDTPPRLWWLDGETGETVPLQVNSSGPSQAARFSADGNWVSYAVSPEQGLEFYDFVNGRHFQMPTSLGTPAVWHPTKPHFLYRNQQLITFHGSDDDDHQGHTHNFTFSLPLLLANVDDDGRSATLVSEMEIIDDASPAWSPDGEWIVFGRRAPGTVNGRQLWLIRADGSKARALTDEPLIHHGVPSWSANGRYILFQRYDTHNPTTHPGIWLLEPATGTTTEIAPIGFHPLWQ